MEIVVNIFADGIIVIFAAADVAHTVLVAVYTIGNISATRVGAFVAARGNIMFCVCGVSTYITNTIVHTGMFTPCRVVAVGTIPPMAIIITMLLGIGVLAIKVIPPADVAYSVFIVVIMGLRFAKIGKTCPTHFPVRLAIHCPNPGVVLTGA